MVAVASGGVVVESVLLKFVLQAVVNCCKCLVSLHAVVFFIYVMFLYVCFCLCCFICFVVSIHCSLIFLYWYHFVLLLCFFCFTVVCLNILSISFCSINLYEYTHFAANFIPKLMPEEINYILYHYIS